MKDISKILEGLLDDDFDVSNEYIEGWMIWSKYLEGVSPNKGYSYADKEEYLTKIEPELLGYIRSHKKIGKTAALNETKYPCVARVIIDVEEDYWQPKLIQLYYQNTLIAIQNGHLSAFDRKRSFPKYPGWNDVGYWEFPEDIFKRINAECKKILHYHK